MIKKRSPILISVFVSLLVLGGAVAVPAQRPSRLKFAGKAAVLTAAGYLNGYADKKVFLVRLRAGQRLSTEQLKSRNSTRYVTVSILDPSGEDVTDRDASCNSRQRVTPTRAGDYRIEVTECRKAAAWRGTFRLRITARR